jgi:hypothetical protein
MVLQPCKRHDFSRSRFRERDREFISVLLRIRENHGLYNLVRKCFPRPNKPRFFSLRDSRGDSCLKKCLLTKTLTLFAMFNQDQIQELKEAFNMTDQDRGVCIDKEDLQDMLTSLGKDPIDEEQKKDSM